VTYHALLLFNFALQAYSIITFFVMTPTVSNNGRRSMFDLLFDRQVAPAVTAKTAKGRTAPKHALIGLGAIMSILTVVMIGSNADCGTKLPFMHNVVCTTGWVDTDTVITKEMVTVARAPSFFIPEGAITEVDQVIGKRIKKRRPPLAALKPSLFELQSEPSQPRKSNDPTAPDASDAQLQAPADHH
jgi:hypothetical protein